MARPVLPDRQAGEVGLAGADQADLVDAVLEVGDRIRPRTWTENEHVRFASSGKHIIAGAADQRIGPKPSTQNIRTIAAIEQVGPQSAGEAART